MQRKTLKPQWMLSVLSVALLAACGGGPGTFSPNDKSSSALKPNVNNNNNGANGPKVIDKTDPTINRFLVNMENEGQQLSPTVVSVDNNNNKIIDPADEIRFNQPGIVSEITTCSKKPGGCDPQDSNKGSGSTGGSGGSSGTDNKDKNDPIVMRDVNNRWHYVVAHGTADLNALLPTQFPRDAGTNKITKKRENGVLRDYGGTIDRRFNSVLLFAPVANGVANPNGYLSAYFRNPAAAGWSYQTFGYFFGSANNGFLDRSRDPFVGYQSIGKQTLPSQMPKGGSADYNGISHGYYNGNQVTALNKLHANFGRRNISYETTGVSQLHTFEGTDHVIEDKPNFNLSGSASWAANTSDFSGDIRTAEGLTGKWQGRFYGPNADEVGGVFGLQGTATDGSAVQYVGGFGAER